MWWLWVKGEDGGWGFEIVGMDLGRVDGCAVIQGEVCVSGVRMGDWMRRRGIEYRGWSTILDVSGRSGV